MKTKTIVKLYKRFARELIDEDIYVVIDANPYYDYVKDIMGVYKKLPDQTEETEKAIADYFANAGVKYHPFTIAFLHELGHLWSTRHFDLDDDFYDEVQEEIARLNARGFFQNPPYKVMLAAYYETSAEKMANEFLFRMVKEKPEVVAKYDAVLSKLC